MVSQGEASKTRTTATTIRLKIQVRPGVLIALIVHRRPRRGDLLFDEAQLRGLNTRR